MKVIIVFDDKLNVVVKNVCEGKIKWFIEDVFVFVWLNYSSDCISGLDVRWLIVLVFKLILEFVLRVFFSNEFLSYFFFVVNWVWLSFVIWMFLLSDCFWYD